MTEDQKERVIGPRPALQDSWRKGVEGSNGGREQRAGAVLKNGDVLALSQAHTSYVATKYETTGMRSECGVGARKWAGSICSPRPEKRGGLFPKAEEGDRTQSLNTRALPCMYGLCGGSFTITTRVPGILDYIVSLLRYTVI